MGPGDDDLSILSWNQGIKMRISGDAGNDNILQKQRLSFTERGAYRKRYSGLQHYFGKLLP